MVTQTVQFVANASGHRVRNIKGVEHVILDMVMLRTGVHAGNLGPIYYSDEELSKSIEAWNAMPLVLNHPTDSDGKHISARRQDVLDAVSFGAVLNSRHKPTVGDTPGSSFCEAWTNMNDLVRVSPKLAERVANNEVIEISTGLTLDLIEESGEWKGQKYTHRAVNFRPDHVAFLDKETGACSVAKGCGAATSLTVNTADQKAVNCSCQTKAANQAAPEIHREYIPLTNLRVGNVDASYSDILEQARQWLNEKHPTQRNSDGGVSKYYSLYSDCVFPGYFAYAEQEYDKPTEYYRVDYTLNDRGKIAVSATETPVERQVQFVPAAPEMEENAMTTNTAQPAAVETPAVVVNTAAPEAVTAVETPAAAPAVTATPEPVAVAATASQDVLTLNQFMDSAPAHLKPALADAVVALNSARAGHIAVITAAPSNKFTADVLNSMSLENLAAIAALATPAAPAAPAVVANAAPAPTQVAARVLNYAGASGAPVSAAAAPETPVRVLKPGSKE